MKLSSYSSDTLRSMLRFAEQQEKREKKREAARRAYEAKQEKKRVAEAAKHQAQVEKMFTDLGLKVQYYQDENTLILNDTIVICLEGGDETTWFRIEQRKSANVRP